MSPSSTTNGDIPPKQYIAEISPPAIRGSLVCIYEINNQFSSLIGYWSNYIVNEYISGTERRQWQIPLAMQIVPSALLVIAAMTILPESPRFLVQHGRADKARKVLSMVRHLDGNDDYINMEMEEIEDAIRKQDEGGVGGVMGLWKELWWRGNRQRVIIGLCLMFGQNLTGIQGMNFYTPTVFKAIGFGGTKVVLLASGMFFFFFLFSSSSCFAGLLRGFLLTMGGGRKSGMRIKANKICE